MDDEVDSEFAQNPFIPLAIRYLSTIMYLNWLYSFFLQSTSCASNQMLGCICSTLFFY
ncbi:unnamed protein product [Trifolium pratense]|uniref:Uncharacterized protein n=1 Tax=Trifolium pratense TaxID=57577 RepID=A0ACB0I7U7_TRIPR|nr:unnamed protein product [Trifolium pratense]